MTVKELKSKLHNLPDDARVEIELGIKVNSVQDRLIRQIDSVGYFDKNNVVSLSNNWLVQVTY